LRKVAIITARGGSKRIPRKNIKLFLDKPIIAYSIEAALESGCFDEVMVSTDDPEIKAVAESFGANVPFIRSSENSNDFATTVEVIKEVINQYKSLGNVFDYGCCLYPTAPFINSTNLKKALELISSGNYDSVFPLVKFSYPIQRGLKVENNKVAFIWPENRSIRSQDLTPAYHDAGQFYWFNSERILFSNSIITDNSGFIELSESEVQDIDTIDDWKLAEFKYQFLKNQRIET
jgi:pseudaminic acid cytidylyltransferase